MTLSAKHVHLVGIAGTGMSGLAKILRAEGRAVTGSDTNETDTTRDLRALGIPISLGQRGEHVTAKTELVVVSAAIKPDNPEFVKARELNIPVRKYAEAVGQVMENRHAIAVAGTHGKTTITSMISYMLLEAGLDPSFLIGGGSPQLGGNNRVGGSDYFIVESCEFDRSFLNYTPRFALINNIEEDHLDYYRDLQEITSAFQTFAERVPANGTLFYGMDCPRAAELGAHMAASRATVSYGFDARADYRATDVEIRDGLFHFQVHHKDAPLGEFAVSIPGWHNVGNALGVIAVGLALGIPADTVRAAVRGFLGAERRFQHKGEVAGVTVIDDYAHHPTEIEAVVQTAMHRFKGRRLWAVFQPHQYSRTRFLMQDFAQRLRVVDQVVLPEIVFVRDTERDRQLVSASDLAREIRKLGGQAVFVPTLEAITDHLINNLDTGDVVMTLGAGDVWKVADELVRRLQSPRTA